MKLHHSIRHYPNGHPVHNAVLDEHLETHIKYNTDMRPGTALFIDGVCVKTGIGISEARCEEIEDELKANPPKMPAHRVPYK